MQQFAGYLSYTERGRTYYLNVFVDFVDETPSHVFITEGHRQHADFPYGSPGNHPWEQAAQKLVETESLEVEVSPPEDIVIDDSDDFNNNGGTSRGIH